MTNHTKAQWEIEFDEQFGDYGTYTQKGLDALETEVKFRLQIKSFIISLLASKKAAIEAKRGMPTKFVPMVSGDYDRGYHHGKVAGLSTALDILGE
jgi:hypothetical protein